jgi:hypothetical protein
MTDIKFGREIEENNFCTADLYKKAIIYNEADIGKLTIRGSETLRHYIAKAVLVYQLKRLRHRVVTEARIEGVGYLDVLDLDCNVIYEIEMSQCMGSALRSKEKYQQTGFDLVIIQMRNWSDDLGWISDYIKHWVRPD